MHFVNLFRLGFRLTVLGAAPLWMGACGYDDEATVSGPQGILASGAYHSVLYGDACRGGGKLNFCSSENLTELIELSSEDPSVVEVIPAEEHPLYPLTSGDYFLLGKTPGETTLTFRGKFDDGSKRSAETEVTVKAIERMDMAVRCDGEEKGDQLLVPVNERGTFDVQLFAGKDELS